MNIVRLDADVHRRVQSQLARYVTGRLGSTEQARVEAHLAGCPRCRAELDAERLLHGNAAAPAPPRRPWWRWVLGAQAFVIALLAGMLLSSGREPVAYRGLGDPPLSPQANVIVMFRAEASEAQIRQALQQAGARFAGGPTASGAYLLALPEADAPTLARLRTQPGVALAEPLQAGSAP